MKPEIKAQWIAALRSGEYSQGCNRLRTENTFCCLGVLCDLHARATAFRWDDARDVDGAVTYLGEGAELPPEVQAWAELNSSEGGKASIDGETTWLASHNDGFLVAKRTFLDIADAIEAQL